MDVKCVKYLACCGSIIFLLLHEADSAACAFLEMVLKILLTRRNREASEIGDTENA